MLGGLPLGAVTRRRAAGYLLGTPSIRRYSRDTRVTIRPVRAISRKGRPREQQRIGPSVDGTLPTNSATGILRGHTPAGSRPMSESKIWSEPHGDMGNNLSEIPCRVSSDLHEWRNDLATVSTRDPAKLHDE